MREFILQERDVTLAADASYKLAPRGVYQVLSFHVRIGNAVAGKPFSSGLGANEQRYVSGHRWLFFGSVFMPDKSGKTTRRAWRAMFPEPARYNIKFIVVDWEKANLKAIRSIWGEGVAVQCCQFHYANNVHKRAKALGNSSSLD